MKKIRVDSFTSTIFILILLFYIIAILSDVSILSVLGKYAFVMFMILIFVSQLETFHPNKRDLVLFSPFMAFILSYSLNLIQSFEMNGIMIVFNLLVYLVIIYLVSKISWDRLQVKTLSYVYCMAVPFLYLLTFVAKSILNTNTIGAYMYFLSFFPLLYIADKSRAKRRVYSLLVLAISFLVILATSTRSIMLSAAFGFMTYFLWRFISSRKVLFKGYFLAIVAMLYGVTGIYPYMHRWSSFEFFNNLSLSLTGKRIMSGRNTIWAQLIDLISERPFFGYGSSAVPEDFLTTSLSAHNLYLQIGLQVGILGLVFLVIFFYFIWNSYWENRNEPKVILAASFFVSILIYQAFEVSLTQNQFGIGLLQWLIIAFGLSYSKRRHDNGY